MHEPFTLRTDESGDWAAFRPLIGGWTDERVSIAVGAAADGVSLVVTARPVDPDLAHAPVGPGVFALRWFECDPAAAEELVELSVAAWPAFEAGTPGTRIFGLFRADPDASAPARFLLCTRYPSVAAWETSRTDTDTAAFRRRRALTQRSQVSLWSLTPRATDGPRSS